MPNSDKHKNLNKFLFPKNPEKTNKKLKNWEKLGKNAISLDLPNFLKILDYNYFININKIFILQKFSKNFQKIFDQDFFH